MPATECIVKRFEVERQEAIISYAYPSDFEKIKDIVNVQTQADLDFWKRNLNVGLMARRVSLLLTISGTLRGVVVSGKTENVSDHPSNKVFSPWWVSHLTIVEDWRGMGLGEMLFRSALTEMQNLFRAKKIGLLVLWRNTPALELYRKCGFRGVKTITSERTGKPEDWFVMVKQP